MAFSQPTLLIIGAGASAEIGFPVGDGLKDLVRSCTLTKFDGFELTGDREYCRMLEDLARTKGGNLTPVLQASEHIHKNVLLSGSIDQFLSSHQAEETVVKCAKLAIAYQIALAERKSHLNDNTGRSGHCDFVYLKDTWYPRLWSRLQNGQPISSWREFFENFRAVSFNYDRCLEQFLTLALVGFCRIDGNEARKFVEELPILHVYGDLGNIAREREGYCPFAPDRNSILPAADRILTFSETVADNIKEQVSEYLSWAKRVVVLGFSYANVNMQLIPKLTDRKRRILGTSLGMSEHNTQIALATLAGKLCNTKAAANLSPVTCAQLFDDFALSLN